MNDYQLLSSTRYDPSLEHIPWNTDANAGEPSPFMLLPYHLDRLQDAAKRHGWMECLPVLTMERLRAVCEDAIDTASSLHSHGPFKVRILLAQYLDREPVLSASASPTKPFIDLCSPSVRHDPTTPFNDSREIYLDTQPTPSSLFTSTKTSNRLSYNAARARINLTPLPTPADAHLDVLLYTPAGLLSETSIRNVALNRNGRWMTPNAKVTGCLPGVMRRLLIEQGKWVEAEDDHLTVAQLVDGELVMTANGVEGCAMARITVNPP